MALIKNAERGMGFHSPYFLLLIKVDRISIIGSKGNIEKELTCPGGCSPCGRLR